MTKVILDQLLKFSQEDWDNYIYQLCHNETIVPSLEFVADNLSQRIFWIHDWFLETNPSKISNLVEAVVRTLKTIAPTESMAETINILIYFISEIKPITQRRAILTLIKTGRFSDLFYGEDNLYLMLLRAYIPLEDEKMEAEEYYLTLKYNGNGYYFLYLQLDYYCALDKEQQALKIISKSLNCTIGDDDEYNFTVENMLIDHIPLPISFLHLVKYLIENNIAICKHWEFKVMVKKLTHFWKENSGEELEGALLFLEDVLLSSGNNAREKPWFLEEMSKHSKLLRQLINTYYGDFHQKMEVRTTNDYIEEIFAYFG